MDNNGQQIKLAIVIPAFKADFFEETLESIAGQDRTDFTVYVGDDCSPHDLKSICDRFTGRMNIRYVRYDTNLGRTDLVAQWERCIKMCKEEWIWFFSDDDLMPSDGVIRVLDAIYRNKDKKFFRLPLQIIDARGNVTSEAVRTKETVISPQKYLLDYLSGKNFSAACEYVFNKSLFENIGMVHFPCAWCSDIATWYSYANQASGMTVIPGAPVSWRNAEDVNISSSSGLTSQKIQALTLFIQWMSEHCQRPFSRNFKRAVRTYIKTVLSISLRYQVSIKELELLTEQFKTISPWRAELLFRVCKLKVNHRNNTKKKGQ